MSISRGYSFKKLFSIIITIGNLDRNILLPYKYKDLNLFNNSNKLWYGLEYNKHFWH